MTCDSRNLIYVVICLICKEEFIVKTEIGYYKLRVRVRIYKHHIRQPEHEKLRWKSILELVTNETLQCFRFYNGVQMTQIFDGNMKITL